MSKIYEQNYEELGKLLEEERNNGKKIVMCSGTFDLFHIGHMRMLSAAKALGDILVVVVKSDKAAALKKEYPPVLNQNLRMETIAEFGSDDYYIILADYDSHRNVPFQFDNVSSFQWLNMFTPIVSYIHPDLFVHEDNPVLTNARNQLFSCYNIKGVIQPRTDGISTTDIVNRVETRILQKMQDHQG